MDVVRREKSPFYVLLNDQLDLSGMELRYDIFCSLAAKERYRKLHDGDAAQPLAWFR